MKTLLKAALMLPLLIIAVHLHAQKVINEGKITYSTSYDIPASQWKNDGSLPTEIVIYFRGDSTAAVVKQGIATIKGVSVLKTNYHSMIIDVPDFNKKLFVLLTSEEVQKEKSFIPQFTAQNDTSTQIINGYHCFKINLTDNATGYNYELWVTKDVSIVPNSVSRPGSLFGGVPIRFVTFNQGIKIYTELKLIEEISVPKGFFSASKEYNPISYEELKKISLSEK
jgi:hypothetical protein